MSDTRTITLGGSSFAVPPLPIRINRVAYPICRRLTAAGIIERAIAAQGALDGGEDELAELVELTFLAANAADRTLTREAFDELAITPPELLDAFFQIRYQTGAWVAVTPGEQDDEPGEAPGGENPPT